MPNETIPDKPKAGHCGFSLYPEHREMLAALQMRLNANKSRVLQHLIEQEYKKLNQGA